MSGPDDRESIERMRIAATAVAERDVKDARPLGFADVIARARALDPDAADEGAIAMAARIDADRERRHGHASPDELARFIASARRLAEADVRAREAEGVPPRRTAVRGRWTVPVVLAIAAAVVVMAIAGLTQMESMRVGTAPPRSQSAAVVEGEDVEVFDETVAARPHPGTMTPSPPAAPPVVEIAKPPAIPIAKPKRSSTEDQLRALADEAEAALARGELARADALLAKLIAIGGRHRLVELAFGDRFTIAHRGGVVGEQTKLWRAYLGKFPRGSFADDARAGLCRHADGNAARTCWTDYLADFPKGAYRSLARRTIEEVDPK